MDITDLLGTIHESLKRSGMDDEDIHEYLGWISDRVKADMDDCRKTWFLRAVGSLGIGFVVGAVIVSFGFSVLLC